MGLPITRIPVLLIALITILALMPFGPYKNFQECVKANQKKRNPKAYCAEIQRRAEKRKKKSSK